MPERDRIESGDALFAFDADMRIVSWNRAAEALTGFAAADVLTRPCWEILDGVGPDGRHVCGPDCVYARRMLAGEASSGPEVSIRTASGRRARVSFSLITVRPDGAPRFLHLVQPRDESGRRGGAAAAPELTARQLEVLELAGEGMSPTRIAAALGIAETTVRNHLSLIIFKLDSTTRDEAVARAGELGLLAARGDGDGGETRDKLRMTEPGPTS